MADATRKLATIVALDVAGYSARTEADEAKTTAEVAALRNAIEGVAARHGGRVFNTAGDGFMLEFGSSLAAVEAAFELAETCEPKVRVGVHLGDVVVQPNGDLLGHGVNVAARLMAQSAPGAALVSAAVRQSIRGPLVERLLSRGTIKLDKMAETMEVFHLAPAGTKPKASPAIGLHQTRRMALIGGAALGVVALAAAPLLLTWGAAPTTTTTLPTKRTPRLAVLRLQRLGDVEPYFADGLAEELINEVARIKGLEAVGRTSSFALNGNDATPAGAARLLGATLMLEGSVRRIGEVVRVTARLLDAPGAQQLWAETFEDTVANIYGLQRKIALRIASALDVRVSEQRPPNVNPEAYELYLRGKLAANTIDDLSAQASAATLFSAAVQKDPNFAIAWSELAVSSIWPNFFRGEGVPAAETAADRAVGLDDQLALPYGVKAYIALYRGQWRAAEELDARAMALGGTPEFVSWTLGRIRDGLEAARKWARLDPLNPVALTLLMQHQMSAGDFEDALIVARRRFEMLGGLRVLGFGSFYILQCLLDLQRRDEARAYIKEMGPHGYAKMLERTKEDDAYFRWRLGDGPVPDRKPIFEKGLAGDNDRTAALVRLGEIGALAEAGALLDKVEARHLMASAMFSVWAAPLRPLPQFWRAMDRVGLTAYWRESGKWPDFCTTERCPK